MQPLIVGAGPIGCFLAKKLCDRGVIPTIIEEHKKIGEPVQCTGLVSTNIKKIVDLPKNVIKNRVYGAKIFSENEQVTVGGGRVRAYVISRPKYDRWLYEEARSAGAHFILGTRYNGHIKSGKWLSCSTSGGPVVANIIIGADGPRSRVARSVGINNKTILGVQYVCRMKTDRRFVQLHVGRGFARGFFAWVVPESGSTARVGLACTKDPKGEMEKFLLELDVKRILSKQVGPIPFGFLGRTSGERVLLVGDAASQVKATTGGGVIYGSFCAEIAADAIVKGRFDAKSLRKNYEAQWLKQYGGELRRHLFIRRVLNSFSPKDYDTLLKIVKNNMRFFLERGDMDFILPLFSFLAKDASLLALVLRKAPRLLKNLGLLF